MTTRDDAVEDAVRTAREDPDDVDAADLDLLLSAVEDGDDQQRRSAAVGLATVASHTPATLAPQADRIRALLAVDDATVRAMTAAALTDLATTAPDAVVDATPGLAAALDDESMVRRHALGALAYVADARPDAVEDAIPAVVDVLETRPTDPVIRGYAMATLVAYVQSNDPPRALADAVPALLAFVDAADTETPPDPQPTEEAAGEPLAQSQADVAKAETTTRNDALTVLVATARAHPDVVAASMEAVATHLDDDATPVRASMAETIQCVTDAAPDAVRPAIGPLAACLDADDTVAGAAMEALATIADHHPDAVADAVAPQVEHVTARLDHGNDAVRRAATGLVAYLAEVHADVVRDSVPTLVDRLDDGDPGVRGQAMWALGFLGADAALGTLDERARADPNPDLQALAGEMAARIRAADE